MAGRLCAVICSVGVMNLVAATLAKPHIYTAGSSPIVSTLEQHGVSTFAHGLPGREDATEGRHARHHANTAGHDGHGTPPLPHHPESAKPKTGKWCAVMQRKVVTYAHLCKTEKYVVRSQEPCPNGSPDCQRTMYRLAQKPVYEIKRKFVTNKEWKCCPGYTGSTCEYSDPNAILTSLEQSFHVEEPLETPNDTEVKEIIQTAESQESLLADIQNDIHQVAGHLLELQRNSTAAITWSHNDTAAAAAGKDNGGIDDRLREVFLPHVESFLKAHFNPMWTSFNKSLQNLNNMVKNLSESVESNRKRLDIFLENTVPKRDLYEMGTKFESKIQENVDKLERLKQDMDEHFHTQQAIIHYNFTMFKADTDMKLKRNMKMQQTQYSFLNYSINELRRGQEQIQDDILDLTQNITILCKSKEEEVTSVTSHQINETLKKQKDDISDLLTELDVAFENISTLEKWIKELRTSFTENSKRVETQFMEKSLIMEEFKEQLQGQIKELNTNLAILQESNDELFNDCDKMNVEILTIVEVQRNLSNQFKDLVYGMQDGKRKEGSPKIPFQNSIEEISMKLQLFQEFKDSVQQQIGELNSTIASIQEGNDELFHDCDCHKMNSEIQSIVEIQRNLSHQFRNLLYGIEDVKRKEGSAKISLQNSVEDLSLELQLNRQSLTAQQEQGRKLTFITSQLQSQTKNFTDDVALLRIDNDQIQNHIKLLYGSFNALLEDATRHERVLEALLGEEVLELFSEDNPDILHLSMLKLHEMLNHTVDRLDKQQIMTDSINDRLHFLEIEAQLQLTPTTSTIFNVEQHNEGKSYDVGNLAHMEPSHEAARDADESEYSDVGILKKDIKYLSEKVNKLESYFADGHFYSNNTIEATLKPLNFSVASVKAEVANLQDFYNGHVELFNKLFGNYEALISSNLTLDVAKIQAVVDKKIQKKQKVVEVNKKGGKKQSVDKFQADDTLIPPQGVQVAFSAGFSKGAVGSNMIKFTDVVLNYGNVFSPDDGHFTAPYSGVYAFAITVDFVPGNARGYLFFGGRQMLVLHNSSPQPAESLKHQFAVVELTKNDKVWFELLQGSIRKDAQGTSLSGFLIFKT